MRLIAGTGLVVLTASAALALGAAPSEAPETATADRPAELIVRFEPGASAADRLEAREEADTDFEQRLPVDGMQVVAVDPGQTPEEAERALEGDDDVLYAEPNAMRSAFRRADDPYFDVLWAMENRGQAIRGTSWRRREKRQPERREGAVARVTAL